jgi:hypothetical protein
MRCCTAVATASPTETSSCPTSPSRLLRSTTRIRAIEAVLVLIEGEESVATAVAIKHEAQIATVAAIAVHVGAITTTTITTIVIVIIQLVVLLVVAATKGVIIAIPAIPIAE